LTTRSNVDRFRELLFYACVLLVGYLAFRVIQPFLAPIAWATILALTLNPLRRRWTARLGAARAALAMTLGTGVVIGGPLTLFASMLASEIPKAVEFVQSLPQSATPERIQVLWDMVRDRSPVALPPDPTTLITAAAQNAIAFLAPRLGSLLADVAATLVSVFVMLFTLFFLLRDADRMAEIVRRLLPFPEEEGDRLIREAHDLVIASVGVGLMVSAVQGLIGGIAFWALGAGAPVAWGIAVAVCSFIPAVGATIVWVPVAVWWLLSGEVWRGVALVIIGAGVIGLVDNVLRPTLLSGRTSVSGLIVFIGLLGGVAAFGLVGLVLGPIVLVIARTLLQALTRRVHLEKP
jgi:predicted PurR-regulated permease PerM